MSLDQLNLYGPFEPMHYGPVSRFVLRQHILNFEYFL